MGDVEGRSADVEHALFAFGLRSAMSKLRGHAVGRQEARVAFVGRVVLWMKTHVDRVAGPGRETPRVGPLVFGVPVKAFMRRSPNR